MAKRGSGGRAARTTVRTTKSKKTVVAPVVDVEAAPEKSGPGIDAGIAILTTVLLVAAILFVDALKGRYDAGMFF